MERKRTERGRTGKAGKAGEKTGKDGKERRTAANIGGDAALGPYPARGEYEHCLTLETPRGDFIPLTPAALAHVARAIEWSRGLRSADRRAALDRRDAAEDRDYDNFADAVLSDAAPAFHGVPFISVA
jgi:hypothetical protein